MKTKILTAILIALFFGTAKAQMPDMPFGFGKDGIDASAVPASYGFSWKCDMEIQTDKGKPFQASYLLEPNADYFGMDLSQGNGMFVIMDNKNKITVTAFGGSGSKKMAKASRMVDYDAVANDKHMSAFKYKTLPDKTILGYRCKGVEASNPDYIMTFYFTNDAPVNFLDTFKSPQGQKIPNAFEKYFKEGDKPLMLSVEIKDVKKAATTTMKCTSLEKSAFVFKKAEYIFM